MSSSLAALTSGGGGIAMTADSSGNLNLLSGTTTVLALTATGIAVTGTLSASGVTTNAAGSAALPSITTTGDTDTGVWFPAANTLAASTGGVEAMRIDSSGHVLVGTTSTSNSVVGLRFNNSVSSGFMQILSTKTLSGELNFLLNYYNGTYVGGINYTNTATSFPTSSDIRLKKDIVDAPSATQKIDNIRIVSHGWKHDDEVVDFGIIAQDLYEIMPRAVSKGDDEDEIQTVWSVDYSKLVPLLIKAHQEQQALIIQLQADVAALKGVK